MIQGNSRRATTPLVTPRLWLLLLVHAVVFATAYWLAYAFRFDLAIPADAMGRFWVNLGWVVWLQLATFWLLGQLHGWWRYVTFADITPLLRASALSLALLATVNFLLQLGIPRGVVILDGILMVAMLGAVRASWRMFREVFPAMHNGEGRLSVRLPAQRLPKVENEQYVARLFPGSEAAAMVTP
jgi:FlaA1/EpsC-like NDP-sugar epimerase